MHSLPMPKFLPTSDSTEPTTFFEEHTFTYGWYAFNFLNCSSSSLLLWTNEVDSVALGAMVAIVVLLAIA